MTTTSAACACGEAVTAGSDDAFPDAYLAHVRAAHDDWPFPDIAVRVVGEALLRLTGGTERVDALGAVRVEPAGEHVEDWLAFFDHDAFPDRPWLAACYCLEQHAPMPPPALGGWRANRDAMEALLRAGRAAGYLAYVDDRPAGWVNASLRGEQVYARSRPDDATTITISCFAIAPPYRGHGLQAALLDRVIADAPARGATRVEAYPRPATTSAEDQGAFRGSAALYRSRGFEVVQEVGATTVVRLELA